jgi:hypothetical protein
MVIPNMVIPNIHVNQSDRKKCHCCNQKIAPGDMCIEYCANVFGSQMKFRSSHLQCWFAECATLPSQLQMEEAWKAKLLKSV